MPKSLKGPRSLPHVSLKHFTLYPFPPLAYPLIKVIAASHRTRLRRGLDPLSALPRIARLKTIPSADAAGFDTDHILVRVLGREVGHALRFVDPGVPHHDVGQHVPGDLEAAFIFLRDGDCLLRRSGVDPVHFGADADPLAGGRDVCAALDFVLEGSFLEAGNGGLGDVLEATKVSVQDFQEIIAWKEQLVRRL